MWHIKTLYLIFSAENIPNVLPLDFLYGKRKSLKGKKINLIFIEIFFKDNKSQNHFDKSWTKTATCSRLTLNPTPLPKNGLYWSGKNYSPLFFPRGLSISFYSCLHPTHNLTNKAASIVCAQSLIICYFCNTLVFSLISLSAAMSWSQSCFSITSNINANVEKERKSSWLYDLLIFTRENVSKLII